MSFEQALASLNEWHFFEEFVYSSTTFRPQPTTEIELADNLVWIGGIVFAFQLKEREPQQSATEASERRWFNKKVLGLATKQIRDTVAYLKGMPSFALKNARGHAEALRPESIQQLHKLVVYLPQPGLPDDCLHIKHHTSTTAGLIHVISGNNYLGIVHTLLTPAEVADYLQFRAELIERLRAQILRIPEAALMGQFLSGEHNDAPSLKFLEVLHALDHRADEWDMSGIIKRFTQRTTHSTGPTDYYYVIREMALLKRHELREFKLRYTLALEAARANHFVKPYRFYVPRTGCGFVIIPITKDLVESRLKGLQNLTLANKYDQRLKKCVGVVIAADEGPWFLSDWCFVDEPWEYDPEMEVLLKDADPFRPVRETELPRYTFSKD